MRNPVTIVAEVGINHSGNIEIAKRLIDLASVAGCDMVKFQKRTPELCVPESQKNKMKEVPWSKEPVTYLQYKKDIEFSEDQYAELFNHAHYRGIIPFASVWDIPSAEMMTRWSDYVKIPSALITNLELLEYCSDRFPFRLMSTGMSTEAEIEKAVEVFNPTTIFHTNSVYPTPIPDLNLLYIKHLKEKYPTKEIGFSSHAFGIVPCYVAQALGASWVEVHVTLDHSMWGSDQSSSVEPVGLFKMVKGIRDMELALSGNEDRVLYAGEEKKRESLRG